MNSDDPVELLENIGPTIARRLRKAGVHARADLARLGPAKIFRRIREQYPNETISVCYYLYSLEGALRGCSWDQIGSRIKAKLREEAGLERATARRR